MDYEKAYKETIDKLRKLHNDWSSTQNRAAKEIELAFPELGESEDEKIRKGLIEHLKELKEQSVEGSHLKHPEHYDAWIAWLKKQGEQEPINEVKPKFNVGDWITNGEYTWKIIDIKPLDYIIQSQTGSEVDDTISHVDEHFHLWTIQDAKDGDVLAAHECLVLFKEIDGLNIRCYCTYHYLNSESFYIDTLQNKIAFQPATKEQCDLLFQKMKEAGYEWDAEKKELNKIEPSCYHNDGLYYAIDILEKTFGKVEGYQSDDGKMEHQTAIETVNALYHKKPAEWSEEDERTYSEILDFFLGDIGTRCATIDKQRHFGYWLKSLKDRVQPKSKQEWSEEDEYLYKWCMSAIITRYNDGLFTTSEYKQTKLWLQLLKDRVQPKQEWSKEDSERILRIHQFIWANRKGDTDEIYQQEQDADWLMSIIPQQNQYDKGYEDGYSAAKYNQWKPSEEQMRAVFDASERNDKLGSVLRNLYDDLRKL